LEAALKVRASGKIKPTWHDLRELKEMDHPTTQGHLLMANVILPDKLWQRLEPLLPKQRRNRQVQFAGRKPSEPRRIVTGILFVLKTGVPWHALPATSDFPSGYTCRRKLRQWHKRGIWKKFLEGLLAELQSQKGIDWRRAVVDSSAIPAPSGGQKTGPNPTARRKLGSKHHLLTDANGVPLADTLTGAQRHDVTQLLPLVDGIPPIKGKPGRPRRRPAIVQGDRAYDSEPHRQALKKRG
jgi:transposase